MYTEYRKEIPENLLLFAGEMQYISGKMQNIF